MGDAFDAPPEFVEIGVGEPLFAHAVIGAGADRAVAREDWLVSDPDDRLVALVPGPGGREARTRNASYVLDMGRQRVGWNVLIRVAGTSRAAAIASPTFGPASYKLQSSDSRRRTSTRLSRRWMGADWRLRSQRKLLLSITPVNIHPVTGTHGRLRPDARRMSGYRIVLAERGMKEISLDLALILALHTVLLDGTIPTLRGPTC
jgi:hypothetical protein